MLYQSNEGVNLNAERILLELFEECTAAVFLAMALLTEENYWLVKQRGFLLLLLMTIQI